MRLGKNKRSSRPVPARAVHQLVPRLAWGDAVGNQVRYLRELLRAWGYASDIFAAEWDEECRGQVRPVHEYARAADDATALLIHHSYESRLVPLLERAPGRKAVVYHNITPSRLFEGFERGTARGCASGRDELLALRPLVDCAYAYSGFSAEELQATGFPHVSVLPFAVDWRAFDVPPDETLRAELDDGCANILFVGRAVPSKYVDDVLRVFTAYQRLYQPRSRLVFAGSLRRDSRYGAWLYGLKECLGADRIHFLGRVSAAQLSACFRTASVYLSMSRHEGFGVPLLEAMYRGVPVVAYGAAAVPETLGGAGLTTLTEDPLRVAQLLAVLERNPLLRQQVLAAQRERLGSLGQETVAEGLREGLRPFLEGALPPSPPRREATGVDLVCPGYTVRPEAPESRLARRMAERLPGARILALRPHPEPKALPVAGERVGGVEVWHFTPDQPVAPEGPLPESTSMQMAVRDSGARLVFLGVDTRVACETLPHVHGRAWGVQDGARPVPEGTARDAEAVRRLGARLWVMEPAREEQVAEQLSQAMQPSERGSRAS